MATYSSTILKTIGKMAKAVTNYHLFSLNNTIRSKIIALGIRKQRNHKPSKRSRGGRTIFHRISTIVSQLNDQSHVNICGSKTPRIIDYRNILTFQLNNTKIKPMSESLIYCALINCRSVINKSTDLQVELVQNKLTFVPSLKPG